jgi:hypothetical protein
MRPYSYDSPLLSQPSSVVSMKAVAYFILLLGCFASSDAWLPVTFAGSIQTADSQCASTTSISATMSSNTPRISTSRLQAQSSTKVTTEIVGAGRIGSLLAQAGQCTVVGRQDSIDPNGQGPILIATRNDVLESIVDKCPENRKKDLVFMQNGYLDNFLASKGLLDNTQALLFFSVTAKGVEPVDGITTVNPEGLTSATGIHAKALAERLAALNLKCNVVSPDQYRPAMFEKLIWICTLMLVGTAKECKSVGQAGSEHGALVEQVITELVAAVTKAESITFQDGTVARLNAYTDVVADFPCGVKEFEWRNQYFYNLGDNACPTHNALLRECAEKGLLSFKL